MFDLLLKDLRPFDTACGLRGVERRDIAIRAGKIAAIAPSIDRSHAREVHELDGAFVSAGWIDIHVHAYGGLALRDVQMVGVLQGATAVVDAGDFGIATFEDFEALMQESVADVYGFIHVDATGIPYTALQAADYRGIEADALLALIERRRDRIRGVKLGALGDMPFHNLEIAKSVAARAGVPYYMHIGEVNHFPAKRSLTQRALALLTQGDIATHIYTSDRGRIVDADGRLVPEVREAQERGVLFDIGYGVGNFSYAIAQRALDEGILPHTISSDQNSLCWGVRADLPAAMSRFLVLGMDPADIVDKVTAAPARALGLEDAGALAVGGRADLTVFRLDSGSFALPDCDGAVRTSGRVFAAQRVYKDGRPYDCDVERIYHRDNFAMKFRAAEEARGLSFDREERRFLEALFAALPEDAEWRGAALHGIIDRVITATGVARRKGLGALYRMLLRDESAGFTPQIGSILARLGAEDLAPYREALAA